MTLRQKNERRIEMANKTDILIQNIEKIIVGKRASVEKVLAALLCGGHVLIEDVPGVGKTKLVSALAKSVDGVFNRIQLTPDIMPSDIVGFSMINPETRELEYKQGAAMCNFTLKSFLKSLCLKIFFILKHNCCSVELSIFLSYLFKICIIKEYTNFHLKIIIKHQIAIKLLLSIDVLNKVKIHPVEKKSWLTALSSKN